MLCGGDSISLRVCVLTLKKHFTLSTLAQLHGEHSSRQDPPQTMRRRRNRQEGEHGIGRERPVRCLL